MFTVVKLNMVWYSILWCNVLWYGDHIIVWWTLHLFKVVPGVGAEVDQPPVVEHVQVVIRSHLKGK